MKRQWLLEDASNETEPSRQFKTVLTEFLNDTRVKSSLHHTSTGRRLTAQVGGVQGLISYQGNNHDVSHISRILEYNFSTGIELL